MRTTSILGSSLAACAAIALAAGPAMAAPAAAPYAFDSAGTGQALEIVVGLPVAIADGLAPVFQGLPGIELVGNELQISLSEVVADLERSAGSNTSGSADAFSIRGSLEGLIEMLAGDTRCIDSPLDVSIPPDAATPLVSFSLLQADCVTDADGGRSLASAKVADLEVNLAGAIELLPAEITAPLTDAIDQVTVTVEDSILNPLIEQVLTPIQDALSDALGTEIDLAEAVRVPELIDLPLVHVDLLESRSESTTIDGVIRNVSTSTLAGVSLLGTICLPDTTYRTEAFSNGLPSGNDYSASIPSIDVEICDTTTLSPILSLVEADGVLADVLVNLGGGELQPLAEVLENASLPVEDLFGGLEDLLATVGVSTIVQGSVLSSNRAADGSSAAVEVAPFRISVKPLANFVGGTPLEGLGVELRGLAVGSGAAAAPAPIDPPKPPAPDPDPTVPPAPNPTNPPAPAPQPAPEVPVNMPKTGGSPFAALLGSLAIGGSLALRRRQD